VGVVVFTLTLLFLFQILLWGKTFLKRERLSPLESGFESLFSSLSLGAPFFFLAVLFVLFDLEVVFFFLGVLSVSGGISSFLV